MWTDLEQRLRRGLREFADSVPVSPAAALAPPAVPDTHRVDGYRPRRRARWIGPAIVAAAVAGIAPLLSPSLGLGLLADGSEVPEIDTVQPGTRLSGGGGDEGPSLPREFAAYSARTGDLSAGPLGPIVATFTYSWDAGTEPVALASDRDAYRVVDAALARGRDNVPAPTLLSGDGTKIAVADGRGPEKDIAVVDAGSGRTTSFKLPFDATVTLLAWSPTARFLAYGARRYQQQPAAGQRPGGQLQVLDTETGRQRALSAAGVPAHVAEAAFSPDGSTLAVQDIGPGQEVVLVDAVSGTVTKRVPVVDGLRLAGQQAWSPDGGSLVLEKSQLELTARTAAGRPVTDRGILDLASGEVSPGPGGSETLQSFLGWRSPTRVVVLDTFKDFSIVESDLTGGMRVVIARVDVDPEDQRYVQSLQLAYAMLPQLRSRSAGAIDRGPWPDWLRWSVLAPLTVCTIGALLFAYRRMSRRTRRRFLRDPVLPLRA